MNGLKVKHITGILSQDFPNAMLFNRNEYLRLFKNYELHQFLLEEGNGEVLAKLSLAVYGTTAFNPLLAPFGGMETMRSLKEEELSYFLTQVVDAAKNTDWHCIRVANFPEALDYPSYKAMEVAYANAGFSRSQRQPDWVFFLEEFIPKNGYSDTAGWEFIYDDEFDLKEIYDFLVKSRVKQGYEFRLVFEDFYSFLNALPEYHALFVLRDKGKLIAAMTGVLVTDKIMYAFPVAYDPADATLDQVLFFYESLFGILKENGFRIFDTGTIFNDQDRLIFSQLGAVKTYKNTFEILF